MFRSAFACCMVAISGFFGTGPVSAQWTQEGASVAGRYKAWRDHGGDYSPAKAIGASSLAFAPNGTLYLACEKYPDILVFDENGSAPTRISLEELRPGVDFEGMSIQRDVLYLVDEDIPCLYSVKLNESQKLTRIPLAIDVKLIQADDEDEDKSNKRSIEGLVVSEQRYSNHLQQQGSPTYVYVLDERDEATGGGKEAKLYVGILNNDQVTFEGPPIVFPLTKGKRSNEWFRLCELFEFRGNLYSLMTLRGEYHVVKLNLEAGTYESVCDFTTYAQKAGQDYDTNFEGAAPHPDGRLFLTADNENYTNQAVMAGGRTPLGPQTNRQGVTRKPTPLICLPLKK